MQTMRKALNIGWVVGTVTLLGAMQAAGMTDPGATNAVANDIAAVPEPGAALLFAAGVGLVAFTLRRARG
jgi:hypothetical protein